MKASVAQSCLTLCDAIYCSPPGSSVYGFSRQDCWSGLQFPSPGDLPNSGIQSGSPELQADSLPSEPPGKGPLVYSISNYVLWNKSLTSCVMRGKIPHPSQNFGQKKMSIWKRSILILGEATLKLSENWRSKCQGEPSLLTVSVVSMNPCVTLVIWLRKSRSPVPEGPDSI